MFLGMLSLMLGLLRTPLNDEGETGLSRLGETFSEFFSRKEPNVTRKSKAPNRFGAQVQSSALAADLIGFNTAQSQLLDGPILSGNTKSANWNSALISQ